MIVLFAHVRTGRWASVMPARLAETLGLTATIRAIPIVEPEAVHTIGLVVPAREPMTPLNAALVVEARRLATTLVRHGTLTSALALYCRRGEAVHQALSQHCLDVDMLHVQTHATGEHVHERRQQQAPHP